jgi:hypothetical protein
MFDRLRRESPTGGSHEGAPRGMAPLPGFFARRARTLPASREVLAKIPRGPALDTRRSA